MLQDVLQLPALGLPGIGALLFFILVYIGTIGPLNYLLLRRIKRPELAWATIPATVLLFVLATYLYGAITRGGQPQISQLALVQGNEGQERGQATAFIGIFSPRRTSYNLAFPAESLVSEVRSFDNFDASMALRWADSQVEVSDVLIDVSSLRTFVYEQTVPVPLQLRSELQKGAGQVQGRLVYTAGVPLEGALLVWGDSAQELGSLTPGATVELDLRSDRDNFPDGGLATREGLFNRNNVLSGIFGGNNFGIVGPNGFQPGIPDPQGIYLLAWSTKPTTTLQLNGSDAAQEGLTLYMVRLNET